MANFFTKNFSENFVAVAPSPATSGTSLTLFSGGGAGMPVTPFKLTIGPPGVRPNIVTAEIVYVTAVVGDVLTFVRAQEGTVARAIQVNDEVTNDMTALDFEQLKGWVQIAGHGAWSPADATTYYYGAYTNGTPGTTAAQQGFPCVKTGTITAIGISALVAGTLGSVGNSAWNLRVNGTPNSLGNLTYTAAVGTVVLPMAGAGIPVALNDVLEFSELTPTWATNPTNIIKALWVLIV